ncbi:tRNA epoxyqueuosine(34) reductase QueG [Rhodopila sp.]|uniref:tRNA epoxyqueuosine(34) reductase QueG n=1 Tax=Rhodopila sp. TaxID=2480087 RepID=UPI003D0C3471
MIRTHAFAIGFDAVGFAPARLGSEARDRLVAFVQAGYHGDMGWLASRIDERSDPQILWPAARSVIVVGFSYAPATDPLEVLSKPSQGAISVYARHRDYHALIKGKLKHLGQFIASRFSCEFKVFVDTAPVMEKPLAQSAGLGWQGKHTNLVSRSYGSWLFLGEVYTNLEIEPDQAASNHCGSCSRCLDICPTHAFPAPYQLEATRCISYLTIEHHGSIPHELRPLIGNRIYGCDDCLAVCPWNRFASATSHEQIIARADLTAPHLARLSALTEETFRTTFTGSPIKRIGRDRFIRNVLIAIGNSRDRTLRVQAASLRSDPNLVVADAAQWACDQLDALP